MISRGKVFGVITEERKFQDAQVQNGRFEKEVHSVAEELLLMQTYLNKAIKAYADNYGDAPALHQLRKVVALGVRAMENHGALSRAATPEVEPWSAPEKASKGD